MNERANRLRELRKKKGLSQIALGLRLHLSQSRISSYEKDGNIPPDVLQRLSELFGVSIDYILRETDNQYGVSMNNLDDFEYRIIAYMRGLSEKDREDFKNVLTNLMRFKKDKSQK